MARRKKSAKDITEQSQRIQRRIWEDWANASSEQRLQTLQNRMNRVTSAARRYKDNINRAINPMASQGVPLYNEKYERKVSQSTYMGLSNG